jgi:hypothetical protein
MGAAVKISRTDHTAEALRGLAAKSNDGAPVRRLLARALILEGHPREDAAELSGMDRQTQRSDGRERAARTRSSPGRIRRRHPP